ncbi:hypothetical protein MPSEU_000340700 [Mayamaea pseudoterrestris]|nr:hypothetical protein MPSEU_000340700 [Mayamaea pseudoterrestris]
MKNIIGLMLTLWIIRSQSFASAASRVSYRKDDTQRRSLQDNKNDKKPADTNKAPPPPPALTVNETRSSNSSSLGFSIESNNAQSTLSAVCSTTYSTSSTSQTAPLSQQTFEFQYYMYTNANKLRKIAEMDQRYLTPLARSVLECSPKKNDYDFVVQGIVAQVHNGTDAATDCASLADGTKCILAVGSFEALIKKAIDSSDNSNGRHLTDQDLSDPDLIIAFGGVLGTLFAGTELLDDEIKSLAFDGFINGFSPGRSSSGMESYPGIDGGGGIDTTNSTVEATKSNNLLLPIVASAVALAVAVTLIVLVVLQRRKRRTAAEGFHNLDCGSSWGEYDEPTKPSDASCSVPPEQSLGNRQTNLKQLEASIEPEFDFDVNTVNHVLGFAGREDELPSDEEQERSSHLELPSYLKIMQRNKSPPPMYDASDLYSTRSDLTPNTVDL